MKKTLMSVTLLMLSCSDFSGSALQHYDQCMDKQDCTTDMECYDADMFCQELVDDYFYGKITKKRYEQLLDD